ncbi:CBS domain-containing protein [Salinarchaeum sp. IM2453]|uniref:CBS domain-containing protein n=1 Tax=Salinarchaeum sp. IM2453 TaxID=2862870 RepID=UPI001C82B3D8|nr:CBS domain-containing protein [Salinarchaeum sp. IM2453]QZA89324.1 CBS domain-containing protein [Salinarchaeum sp. IM2453]
MNVAEAMTPRSSVVTVEIPGSRDDALEYLQNREFSSVPVVKPTDDGEEYRGIVTRESLIERPDEDQLALLMDDEIPTVAPDASITDAASLMFTEEERRLPVVDDSFEGIITVTDVVRSIAEGEVGDDTPVGDIATREIMTTHTDTPIGAAERQLFYANVPYAIVLDDSGGMAGIVTSVDILRTAEIVEGSESTGNSFADQDNEWMWEGIKGVGSRTLPTRNVELPSIAVDELMTDDVITIATNKSIQDAAQTMITHDIEQIPLVSGDKLVGIVRDIDLLRAL